MIIKSPDEKKSQLEILSGLQERPDVGLVVRKRIEQEIKNVRAGIKGEAEAAYEIDFHFGQSKNYAIIHDLRIECEGRVAQIDHLIIGRFLDIWVCETKHFSEGIAINDHGECSAFYRNRPYGVASPFEQNRKHILVMESAFKSGLVSLPTRLGFAIKPRMTSLVLVSKGARISRPKVKIEGMDRIIKNDQLRSFIEMANDEDASPIELAKLISTDTLERFASSLACIHNPIRFNWAGKFGLPIQPCAGARNVLGVPPPLLANSLHSVGVSNSQSDSALKQPEESKTKQKLICTTCSSSVAYNVARFCWFNKQRFGGDVYCMECQKAF